MAVVFQAYNLFPHLTALQNIILPLTKTRGVPPAVAKAEALALLDRFGLGDHLHKFPNQLSGGQKAASGHRPGFGAQA